MTTSLIWGAIQRGNLKALADHERDYGQVIPPYAAILVWEKVSFWQRLFGGKPPRTEAWGSGDFDPGRVSAFCWEAGSPAERAFATWSQPGGRTY